MLYSGSACGIQGRGGNQRSLPVSLHSHLFNYRFSRSQLNKHVYADTTSASRPVEVSDVGVGDHDAVPDPQVVLVDDVPDGAAPQQRLPPRAGDGGGANVCTEGDVAGAVRRLAVAILQHLTVPVHGHDRCDLTSPATWKLQDDGTF